ncbi:hypothetical protein [Nocardia sp. NPDC052566]|uniref:hypothetical protein n=1 Tax=Nocardia sp. NPDC052566 TaxID=3364330 RepID=UPI0037C50521
MTSVVDVLTLAAERLTKVANDATAGPWARSHNVPTTVRCADAADGSEQHLCYGIERSADLRLVVGFADPDAVRLLSAVFAKATTNDANTGELLELATYLSQKIGLNLPTAERPQRWPHNDATDD